MNKEYSVRAIEKGVVIDHIPAGQGIKILNALGNALHEKKMLIATYLNSRKCGRKDVIKLENVVIPEESLRIVAVFAPDSTVSIIQDFQVVKKEQVSLPQTIQEPFSCMNLKCISHKEMQYVNFSVKRLPKAIKLTCCFCEHPQTL